MNKVLFLVLFFMNSMEDFTFKFIFKRRKNLKGKIVAILDFYLV